MAVREWLERVRAWAQRESQTERPIATSPDLSQDDAFVVAGAAWLCRGSGVISDGETLAGRTFWRMWARWVLANAGLSVLQGPGFDVALRPFGPNDLQPPGHPAAAALLGRHAASYPIDSAECSAISLEATCLLLDEAQALRLSQDMEGFRIRAASVIATLLGDAKVQSLEERSQATSKKGGASRGKERQKLALRKLRAFERFKADRPKLSETALARSYLAKHDRGWLAGPEDERERKVRNFVRTNRRRAALKAAKATPAPASKGSRNPGR